MPFAMLLMFALTLFTSASLLFLVQPMVGKLLLPFLGGTPAIWATCMVFFQALLLAGYAYAHGLARLRSLGQQVLIHAIVLLLPLAPLFLLRFDVGTIADQVWAPSQTNPVPWLLTTLFLVAGLPFFVVSTTAPLLQTWFAGTTHRDAKDPYFLYGASNAGSMGALLLYPALVEPQLWLKTQALWWAFGYAGMALLILVCAWLAIRSRSPKEAPATETPANPDEEGRIPTWFDRIRWVLLAFVPSSVMIGCTTHLTTDIAAVPLLWILPLTVYLASFIFVFSRLPLWLSLSVFLLLPVVLAGWLVSTSVVVVPSETNEFDLFKGSLAHVYYYTQGVLNTSFSYFNLRHLLTFALVGILVGGCFRSPQSIHILMVVLAPMAGLAIAFESELERFFQLQEFERILLHVAVLFVVAMVCHGELARTRPQARYLTEFFLLMSLGGVLGGMFNALLAPVVFDRIVEYPLMVAAMLLLLPWPGESKERGWAQADSWVVAGFGVLVGVLLTALFLARVYVQAHEARTWVEKNLSARWQPLGRFLANQLDHQERRATQDTGYWVAIETNILKRERNFFGTFTILAEKWTNRDGITFTYHKMLHGTTTHGVQCLNVREPDGTLHTDSRDEALSYFHETGPIGDIFQGRSASDRPVRIGIIGVGTGTLGAYARPGWEMTLYDIDPVVKEVALDPEYFTFLRDAEKRGVKVDIVLGDGRQEIKKAPDHGYDIIVIDAFTSDAIPLHLLTHEAVDLYRSKLAPGGILIFNIANRWLDLEPILGNLCQKAGLVGIVSHGDADENWEIYSCNWVVIGEREEDLGLLPFQLDLLVDDSTRNRWAPLQTRSSLGVWTDDYANLLSVFRWGS